jgi:hypothetical protein
MNPAAILALIGDLYSQITQLSEENKALREAAQKQPEPPPGPST